MRSRKFLWIKRQDFLPSIFLNRSISSIHDGLIAISTPARFQSALRACSGFRTVQAIEPKVIALDCQLAEDYMAG